MGRYKVEFKAFKTGEWYTKTSTDNIWKCLFCGRVQQFWSGEQGDRY